MAIYKKGDTVIIIVDGFQKRMTVRSTHGYEVECEYQGNIEKFDEDDLTLFARPGITASKVKEGEEQCEVHLYLCKEMDDEEQIGYGRIYEYDGHLWLVDSKDNVYCAEEMSDDGVYIYFDGDLNVFAYSEDYIINHRNSSC